MNISLSLFLSLSLSLSLFLSLPLSLSISLPTHSLFLSLFLLLFPFSLFLFLSPSLSVFIYLSLLSPPVSLSPGRLMPLELSSETTLYLYPFTPLLVFSKPVCYVLFLSARWFFSSSCVLDLFSDFFLKPYPLICSKHSRI